VLRRPRAKSAAKPGEKGVAAKPGGESGQGAAAWPRRRCRQAGEKRRRRKRRNNFAGGREGRRARAAHGEFASHRGFGNPGAEYAQTRHNAGFTLVEKLAVRWNAGWTNERKFNARVARAERNGVRVLLCQAQTFMNLSGEAVGALKNFYQLQPQSELLVAVDDADLPLAKFACGGWWQWWPSRT